MHDHVRFFSEEESFSSQNTPLDQEPNFTALKETGERQECIGLAVLKTKFVCMHDWFCSWDTYTLCEFRK